MFGSVRFGRFGLVQLGALFCSLAYANKRSGTINNNNNARARLKSTGAPLNGQTTFCVLAAYNYIAQSRHFQILAAHLALVALIFAAFKSSMRAQLFCVLIASWSWSP